MDPLSITAATIGLATFCGQAINILLKFAGNSSNIEFTIQTFADEVCNLDRVLKSITASSKDRSILSLAAGTGHEAQHWRDVLTSLGECRSCITRLVTILENLEGDNGNVLKRTRRQLRLSIESGEIAVLRRQILSFTQTMQISLQMLLLSSHLSTSEGSPQAILPRLDDINSNIHEILKLVRGQLRQGTPTLGLNSRIVYFTNQETSQSGFPGSVILTEKQQLISKEPKLSANIPLRPKVDAEMADDSSSQDTIDSCGTENSNLVPSIEPCPLEIQPQTLETHQSVMRNMQACLQSAGSLISSMSTTLSTATEQFLASDFNCSVTGEQRGCIEDWITSAGSNHSNGDKDKMGGQEPSGPIVFKSIEHEILSKFYSLGKQHFEAAEYPNAEQFLCRFLSMDSASPDGDHSRRSEAREILATSLIKQRKLIEAERVLLACIGDAPEKDLRAIRSTYSLAEIYLETGQSDKAEIYCKRSLKEADEVFGRTHPLVNQSGELLMEIYRNTGDLVALQACSSTIFPGRIVSGGFRWNKAVSLLKDNGFSLEGMDQERKSNALRWAAEKGLENVVLVLLETKDGIKNIVDLKDRIGKTALHYAAAYGHASIAKLLLQNSADVEIRAACSMRALHLAAHYAEVEVVRVLLDHGAEIESRTNDGKTVLHHAVERNSLTIIQLMISRQANIEARDLKQRTPIFWGCQNDRMDAIKLLLLSGANFMAKDVEGNTALHWAAWYGQVSMVKLFVEHGADLSAKGVNDENPLSLAVSNGHARAVMILLDYGAPTELKNSFGRTALHFAAKKGNLDIVCLLLRVGANILACDNTGKTVLDVARDNRQKAVSTYLSAKVETRR